MHRIDGQGNENGKFKQGTVPSEGTVVTAEWLNDVQESLCYVIETAKIALEKGKRSQLLDAMISLTKQSRLVDSKGNTALEILDSGGVAIRTDTSPGGLGPLKIYARTHGEAMPQRYTMFEVDAPLPVGNDSGVGAGFGFIFGNSSAKKLVVRFGRSVIEWGELVGTTYTRKHSFTASNGSTSEAPLGW